MESFSQGFPVGARCFPALCQHCLVTWVSQPSMAIKLSDMFSAPLSQGCPCPVVLTGCHCCNKQGEMCRGFEGPKPSREVERTGCPDLGEAGNFPWWVWIPREMVRSQEAGNFLLAQNNFFLGGGSFLLGFATMGSFIQVQRQARASDFSESLPPTSPLVQG